MSEELKIEETEKKEKKEKKSKIRFEWLDQFRGIIIILFIIQTCAWIFSNDPANGIMPLMAPALNHGFKYADYERPLITMIDLGQQIFIFLVGFMQAFAVLKRKDKGLSDGKIWIHIGKRFVLVMILSVLHGLAADKFDSYFILALGTLANIAWAGLAAGIAALYIPKPKFRLIVGLGVMLLQSILYIFEGLHEWEAGAWEFPFMTINHIAIGLVASAFTLWFLNPKGEINEEGIKKNVLPLTVAFLISSYLLDFIQWSDHHKVSTPLAMLAVSVSTFFLYAFYHFDKDGFHVPGLSTFGKNMLMVFLFSMVINELVYYGLIEGYLGISGVFDMILLGIVPILLIWIIAWIFEKLNWIIKI
ncbi:DUF5009 domain-containing protein [Promethearchaeum syntrophicum]|uniref:DUF5009 domain-containing protein n=1 Tax=Promethearchaeum syntrophicum TaxID=2594042 RepID=A0A5B9DAR0_9ARCH|nr:DUF5009 domain-containing protein [Candidatus Prometheoarchaeum syntrophicum]QEE16101.1 hypothetical protein DSAG12_01930 [Candidatus Prometheoarchaeum syntrophicum]